MLLPSALSCDASLASSLARQQAGLFVSPPASPPILSSQYSIDNIMNTCRSLQSLIAMTATATATADSHALAPAPSMQPLPTPPLAHAPTPMKLRLRSRASRSDQAGPVAMRKIAKRAPPRGVNKRRRLADDDMGRDDDDVDSENDHHHLSDTDSELEQQQQHTSPSTPKRARLAPEQLPLGLERSDFHNIHLLDGGFTGHERNTKPSIDVQVDQDGDEWSAEDDRILVELVLEKLKLSKTEWQECARGLGRDRHSVNRRWKSLIVNGDIGLKARSSRRARLHSTWR